MHEEGGRRVVLVAPRPALGLCQKSCKSFFGSMALLLQLTARSLEDVQATEVNEFLPGKPLGMLHGWVTPWRVLCALQLWAWIRWERQHQATPCCRLIDGVTYLLLVLPIRICPLTILGASFLQWHNWRRQTAANR